MSRQISTAEFEELYRSTVRDLFAYVGRRSRGDVEDLVAEVYAVAWRRRADLPAPVLRRAWLFGVARTLVATDARHRAQEGAAHEGAASLPAASAPVGEESDAAAVVRAAMADLSANDREVLQLVEWERLTHAELAVALGVRPGAARVRLHRARQALARDKRVQALLGTGGAPRTTAPVDTDGAVSRGRSARR
ncbi:sigma-70 family RNA polymerase sigma factor [Nocardioides sp. TF02-7]|uniref:RNA polymerase sigma factor n=1 Tax=Nocardioides sp. TF02-7 TaxID=2917724 RepID=UPI001F070A5C|nr:sigma-70 family RNA polymerase sigma factor [Nocardioides sp. TF02-7]UMG94217.1 sigma-70 family RNA polymerase sigma factor [Nocardioides sp. TF02-7]